MVTSDCALSLYADDNLLFCEIIESNDNVRVLENINLVHACMVTSVVYRIQYLQMQIYDNLHAGNGQDMDNLYNSLVLRG